MRDLVKPLSTAWSYKARSQEGGNLATRSRLDRSFRSRCVTSACNNLTVNSITAVAIFSISDEFIEFGLDAIHAELLAIVSDLLSCFHLSVLLLMLH